MQTAATIGRKQPTATPVPFRAPPTGGRQRRANSPATPATIGRNPATASLGPFRAPPDWRSKAARGFLCQTGCRKGRISQANGERRAAKEDEHKCARNSSAEIRPLRRPPHLLLRPPPPPPPTVISSAIHRSKLRPPLSLTFSPSRLSNLFLAILTVLPPGSPLLQPTPPPSPSCRHHFPPALPIYHPRDSHWNPLTQLGNPPPWLQLRARSGVAHSAARCGWVADGKRAIGVHRELQITGATTKKQFQSWGLR